MKHIEVMIKWCKKIEIEIFDTSLDHVTFYEQLITTLCGQKNRIIISAPFNIIDITTTPIHYVDNVNNIYAVHDINI